MPARGGFRDGARKTYPERTSKMAGRIVLYAACIAIAGILCVVTSAAGSTRSEDCAVLAQTMENGLSDVDKVLEGKTSQDADKEIEKLERAANVYAALSSQLRSVKVYGGDLDGARQDLSTKVDALSAYVTTLAGVIRRGDAKNLASTKNELIERRRHARESMLTISSMCRQKGAH